MRCDSSLGASPSLYFSRLTSEDCVRAISRRAFSGPFARLDARNPIRVALVNFRRDTGSIIWEKTRVPISSPAQDPVTVVDHPLVRAKLARLRERETSSEEFRARLRELSALMVFESARDLQTVATQVRTPLAPCEGAMLARPVIIAPILRAGMGMADGILQVIPDASLGHVGLFRNEDSLRPESYYFKMPSHLPEADVLVVDPMLATGWSATAAIAQLKTHGARHLRFICVLTCPEGIRQLRGAHPDVPIFTAAIDDGLDSRGYISPGLGYAGDRYFGTHSLPPKIE
jgi:uracil phosphoribosyltransferase